MCCRVGLRWAVSSAVCSFSLISAQKGSLCAHAAAASVLGFGGIPSVAAKGTHPGFQLESTNRAHWPPHPTASCRSETTGARARGVFVLLSSFSRHLHKSSKKKDNKTHQREGAKNKMNCFPVFKVFSASPNKRCQIVAVCQAPVTIMINIIRPSKLFQLGRWCHHFDTRDVANSEVWEIYQCCEGSPSRRGVAVS